MNLAHLKTAQLNLRYINKCYYIFDDETQKCKLCGYVDETINTLPQFSSPISSIPNQSVNGISNQYLQGTASNQYLQETTISSIPNQSVNGISNQPLQGTAYNQYLQETTISNQYAQGKIPFQNTIQVQGTIPFQGTMPTNEVKPGTIQMNQMSESSIPNKIYPSNESINESSPSTKNKEEQVDQSNEDKKNVESKSKKIIRIMFLSIFFIQMVFVMINILRR